MTNMKGLRWNGPKEMELVPGTFSQIFSGDHMTMMLNWLPAGSKHQLHDHPHEQIFWLIEGSCKMTIGEEEHILQPGDIRRVPGGVPHAVEVLGENGVCCFDAFSPARGLCGEVRRVGMIAPLRRFI